ncbi:hypothetical protein [Fictibacillus phosphorivorans]|uniref:hypothetical protein n=1 Tax=Fictibacillus phosphorivorans TaxID=1221500 RepID=UPI001292E64C|nr:hypothetical protein [Fictibacillus phosphorivorans]MQR95325.1 hypothetical protein [Fictibacillus phosphorivorans]
MTTAVILTETYTGSHNTNTLPLLLQELDPYFKEKILITDQPSLYLPFVNNQARILVPFYKRADPLSSLHTALSLALSNEVWLIHESKGFSGIHIFEEIKKAKEYFQTQGVLYQEDSKTSLTNSLFDKSVLRVLQKQLSINIKDTAKFLRQINYVLVHEQK